MSEHFLYLVQQLLNGLTIGSTYALIAIGYTMVYGIIGMINFAHGEVYMIGSYVAFMVMAGLMMMGIDSTFLLLGGAFLVSIIITGTYAGASSGSPTGRCAAATADPPHLRHRHVDLLAEHGCGWPRARGISPCPASSPVAGLWGGRWFSGQPLLYAADHLRGDLHHHAGADPVHQPLPHGPRLPCLFGRYQDGQPVRDRHPRVISITFVLGAALAAIAGVLLGMYYGVINPYLGFMAGLKAFTAAVLGGSAAFPAPYWAACCSA